MSKYSETNFFKSFGYARRGLKLAIKSQKNFLRQIVAAVITIIAALSSYIVSIPMGNQEFGENIMFGSLVLSSPFLGYFVIGFISFLLGISFTMLCLHVQKRNRR